MPEQSRKPHPNALPNYERAVIAQEKLEKYALDPNHVTRAFGKNSGQDKARVFKRALGFDQSNWDLLRKRILKSYPTANPYWDEKICMGRGTMSPY